MTPSQQFHTRSQKFLQSLGGEVEAGVAGEEVAPEPTEAVRHQLPPKQLHKHRLPGGTEAPSTLTFQPESGKGVLYIIAGAARLISVRSLPRVRGKIFLHQSSQDNNETKTNSAKNIETRLM